RSPGGRGGGRASAALPLVDDVTTSPASRRLASARPALAPKCTPYFLTGPQGVDRRRSWGILQLVGPSLAKLGGSITLICNFQGGDIIETKRPKAKMAGRCRIVCSPAVFFCARSG